MIVSSLESTGLCPTLYQSWTGKESLDALCASFGPTLIDDVNECLKQPCHVNATCTGNEVCNLDNVSVCNFCNSFFLGTP